MAIILDNGANPTAVNFNGQDMTAVVVNGTQVWTKPAVTGTWKNAWSGLAFLINFDDVYNYEYLNDYTYNYLFQGMTANIQNKTTQVDAIYNEMFIPDGGADVIDQEISWLTAARNNNSETTNLPWGASGFLNGYLSELWQDGSDVYIDSVSQMGYLWSHYIMGYFTVSNIWYYDK